ncbi:hypothetical protein FDP41_008440 [Naegleria fowleri]|uniref:Uncharacterized protein n=1 Tax=Naegleria fowleri TaxID=5763 RepID=A0A6A5B210_NAEFO|nr:uncharacterized protein FDP41_008440 [Naegleria fowleri]KAF0973233.1 hypothetical protein FDP41_008440 [Naegleria fowleri]
MAWSFLGWSFGEVSEHIEKGKELLGHYKKQSDWSNCWRDAVNELVEHCKQLKTDEMKRTKLAIQITNCHLSKSGLRTYECKDYMTIQECTKDMITSPIAFNSYTEFSTHVDNICFFIKSELFQEQSDQIINNLLDETIRTMKSISSLNEKALKTNEIIQTSMEIQEKILRGQNKFDVTLKTMKKLEYEFFQNLTQEFLKVNSLSKNLFDELHHIATEQSKHRTQVEDHFHSLNSANKELSRSLDLSLQQTKRMSEDQAAVIQTLDSLNQKQNEIYEISSLSLRQQDQLLKAQNALQKLQQDLHTLTSRKLESIEVKSLNIEHGLEKNMEYQNLLFEKQKQAEHQLTQLQDQQQLLFQDAKRSLEELLKYNEDTALSIKEQHVQVQKIMNGVMDIISVNTSLLGEYMDIKSVLFYSLAVVLTFLLTSSKYTQNARLYIYLVFTLNLAVEKYILSSFLLDPHNTTKINYWKGICRQLSTLLSFLCLILSFFLYKDYSQLSFEQLAHLRKEILDLRKDNFSNGRRHHQTTWRDNHQTTSTWSVSACHSTHDHNFSTVVHQCGTYQPAPIRYSSKLKKFM